MVYGLDNNYRDSPLLYNYMLFVMATDDDGMAYIIIIGAPLCYSIIITCYTLWPLFQWMMMVWPK